MVDSEILSINIGKCETIRLRHKISKTGIFKIPVGKAVQISKNGVGNDVIINQKHHGGKDQAVYIYSQEDYEWWARELNRELPPGIFGENLTILNFPTVDLRVGDRLQINDVELELTSVRIPCTIFAARMNDPDFVEKFQRAGKPGVYARVLSEGRIGVGDPVKLITGLKDYPNMAIIFDNWHKKEIDSDLLKAILAAPVAERTREKFLKKMPV